MEELINIIEGIILLIGALSIHLFRLGLFTKKENRDEWRKKINLKAGDSLKICSILAAACGFVLIFTSIF